MGREIIVVLAAAAFAAACGEGRREATPAPVRAAAENQGAPGDGGRCDLSTSEAAFRTYARLKGIRLTGDLSDFGCMELLPELDSALFGVGATGAGCIWNELLYGCKILGAREAASPVLSSKGFAGAKEGERAALAMLWARKVTFAGMTVIDSATPAFAARKKTFSPPEAKAIASGGAEVRLWIGLPPGIGSPGTMEHHVVTFGADGAIVSDAVADTIEYGVGCAAKPGPA